MCVRPVVDPSCSGFTIDQIGGMMDPCPITSPQKITFAEMRDMGVRGVLIYCAGCSHSLAVMADRWADDVRLSDIEPRFICSACGKRGADVRSDFNWRTAVGGMGYR
jgi:hypothetical protein